MLSGKAYKPFVYRQFFPMVINTVSFALPESVHENATQIVETSPFLSYKFHHRLHWEPEWALEYFIATFLLYACLLGFAILFKSAVSATMHVDNRLIQLSPFVALLGLPPFFRGAMYIYDFPQLFLFMAMICVIYHNKYLAYYTCLPLACLNKETSILLIGLFFLHHYASMEKKTLWKHIIGQCVVFMVIKGSLWYLYRQNPGSFVEFHLFGHNREVLFSGYGFTVVLMGVVWCFLLGYAFDQKPYFWKVQLLFAIPLVGSALFLGFLDEYRDYYEVYPAVLALSLDTIQRIWFDREAGDGCRMVRRT